MLALADFVEGVVIDTIDLIESGLVSLLDLIQAELVDRFGFDPLAPVSIAGVAVAALGVALVVRPGRAPVERRVATG